MLIFTTGIMFNRNFILSILTSLIAFQGINAQDSANVNYASRKVVLVSASALLAGGSLIYLNNVWFSQYNTGKFHIYNDNGDWFQMDKVGHSYTNYQTSRLMMDAFDWAGFNKKQQLVAGGSIGFVYMGIVDFMDGFSKGWGFSWGDIGANTFGTGMAVSQKYFWDEQRIFLKFSYRESDLAYYNSSLLGNNIHEKILKDYNAQAYWLSFNPFLLINKNTKVPHWLNLSIGYGGTGMIRGRDNYIYYSVASTPEVEYYIETERYRNFYLSLDLDFTKIKTKSKALKKVFNALNLLKVPFPTFDLNKKGVRLLLWR